MANTIRTFAIEIANNLGINVDIIIDSISQDILEQPISDEQMTQLQGIQTELSTIDQDINEFGRSNVLGDNFIELKNNLGKLQVLALIKKLKQAEKCEDVLNAFTDAMKYKIEKVNTALESNLQSGGRQKYYIKYMKYKKKYLLIKKNI